MMKKLILPPKKCLTCEKLFYRESCKMVYDFKEKKYCSRKCFFKNNVGPNNGAWKSGTKTRPDGYIRDSKTDRYIHRILMEKHLGRKLKRSEHVHHINRNPSDNRIENLVLTSNSDHQRIFHPRKRDKYGRFKNE